MKRFFNTAGPCRPELHYTVDPEPRLSGVRELIESQSYFVLHAPRQTGKTTYLYAMMHKLNAEGKYTALQVNIQSAASGRDPQDAMRIAALSIHSQALNYLPESEMPPDPRKLDWSEEDGLKGYLEAWCRRNPKPVVLFVDEADSLMDELFLALLRQLRAGFEARPKGFPHSLALVGLRDVRDYKIRMRPDSASLGTGSPFNVKSKSLFMEGFTEAEVNTLLGMHTEATGQVFPPEVRAEIWRLSQGQPWLTNALANEIVAEVLGNDFSKEITLAHVTQAREALIRRRDTHLDSLVDKLREPPVRQIVTTILNGDTLIFDGYNDAIRYTADLGLVTRKNPVRLANPIYQEIIPRIIGASLEDSIPEDIAESRWYIKDGRLDMDALLRAFQEFYRENAEAWLERYDFREVGRQLLLMAFMQRIVNGGGRVEREMAVGSGRCDLFLEYGQDKFVIELKLNRKPQDEARGLTQTARYLDKLGMTHGYLLLFEMDPKTAWGQRLRWEAREQDGKRISLVGM